MKSQIKTIVKANLWHQINNGQKKIIATNVFGRRCVRSGSTYNCFLLEVKLDDGEVYTLARGFMQYGYDFAYRDRASEVLSLIDKKIKIDFWACEDVKVKDMFNIKFYEDDIKSGYWLDITDELTA